MRVPVCVCVCVCARYDITVHIWCGVFERWPAETTRPPADLDS